MRVRECLFYDCDESLRETGTLPSAYGTRQRLKNTRQRLCRVLHSANDTRQKMGRQRCLCRVFFVEHSANTLPSAKPTLGKEFLKSIKKLRHQGAATTSRRRGQGEGGRGLESVVIGRRSGCMGMAMSMMTTLFCGEVSRTQMYFSDSMVTWVKVTNCGAMPRLVSCGGQATNDQ